MKKILAFLAGVTLVASSCETIVDVDTPPHTPRLALTYTLSNQAQNVENQAFFNGRDLFVSNSQNVLDMKELEGRSDATVHLLDEAGQIVEQFRSKGRPAFSGMGRPDSLYGYYVPTRSFVGTPGRTYTLRASAPDFEPVEATLTLPALPVIESAAYVPNSATAFKGRLTVSVTDQPATTDYYLAYGRVLDRNGRFWGTVRADYSSSGSVDGPDVKLGLFQLSAAYDIFQQYPFSDAGSNAQRLNLSTDIVLQFTGGCQNCARPNQVPAYIEVIISSITADTYQFYQSRNRYNDTDGNPFAEPAPLFSNVRPGYGLFGGAADVAYRIPL